MSDKKSLTPELSEKRRNAGKKGGATTRDRHGKEHFVKIGAMGAAVTNEMLYGIPQVDNRCNETPTG